MKFLPVLLLCLFSTVAFSQIDHWETAVYADNDWRYFLGINEPPINWTAINFSDASWLSGEGGIGYADGDDNTIISPVLSLYQRYSFSIADKTKIERIVFHADYDDGFIAYLNGTEIARANINGANPPFNTQTPVDREALMYQGGLPEIFYINPSDFSGILEDGVNVLSIQTHNFNGLNSSDLTALYWLSFGINDESEDYGETPDFFESFIFSTPLPIVKINTNGVEIFDDPSIPGEMGIIWNGENQLNSIFDDPNEYLGNISIEKRGQSSLFLFPKNGYKIETKDATGMEDEDVEFLNFPLEEDWILHGPFSDKTLIRNVLAMKMANDMGQYASRTRLVELLVNEQYEGVYVLMERIKRDENRVDIATINPEDIAGDELTGGYVFKIDKDDDDWVSDYNMFNNPGEKLRFQYVSPSRSKIEPIQENYLQSYVDSFETALFNPNVPYGGKYYYEYIDLESFAEHFIIKELTKDVDAYRISSYYNKDKDSNGGLIKAGPVWDFNLAFGNADYCEGGTDSGFIYNGDCSGTSPFWWDRLYQQQRFRNVLNCRWEELREGPYHLDSLFAFIDEKAELVAPAAERNFQRWPILDEYIWPNAAVTGSYAGEIEYLKDFLTERIEWLDNNILGECVVSVAQNEEKEIGFSISPNPLFLESLTIDFQEDMGKELNISIYDVLGRRVFFEKIENPEIREEIMLSGFLVDGFYTLKIERNGVEIGEEKLLVKRGR